MTGSGAIAVSGDDGPRLGDSALGTAERATASDESEFRSEWKRFLRDVEAYRSKTDVTELLENDLLVRAFDVASRHPELVSLSEAPFGRNRDMSAHTRKHFDKLFNDDAVAGAFKNHPAATDVDALLRASELVYLDDAVARFSTETIFDPTPTGLERVAFYELPSAVSQWMMGAELLFRALDNRPYDGRPAADLMGSLYDRRRGFVRRAKDADSFLLVPADSDASPAEKRRKIATRVRRGSEVDPADVHAYCYGRALDLA